MSHTFELSQKEPVQWHLKQREKMADFHSHRVYQGDVYDAPRSTDADGLSPRLEGKSLYSPHSQCIPTVSALADALSHAFNGHLPLVLTPDAVWQMILVGLSHHIESDPEGLRHHFVAHKGKKELCILVDKPLQALRLPKDWEVPIGQFADKIKDHIGKKHDLIVAEFSTTTPVETISYQISLMSSMQHYFRYKMRTLCGLTRVTVEGTPDDWANIHDRVSAMSEFDLQWWTSELLPVIRQFEASCAGTPDREFWNRAYLRHGGSGSGSVESISGWINVFHPYLAASPDNPHQRNPHMDWNAPREIPKGSGVELSDLRSSLVSVPVLFQDLNLGTEYDLKFYGGLAGVEIEEDGTVSPVSAFSINQLSEGREIDQSERTETASALIHQ